jgi:hypothetical protein
MSQARRERALRNEEFFRGANRAIARDADDDHALIEFLCECASIECTTRLRIAPDDWRDAHEGDLCFVVAPGHVFPDVERVVRSEPRYDIVEKFPV